MRCGSGRSRPDGGWTTHEGVAGHRLAGMGGDRPEAEAGRRANQRSATRRWTWIAIAALVVAGATAVAIYLWLEYNRGPVHLKVGAGPVGSDTHQLMTDVAAVVERHSDALRLEIRPTRDPSENISLVNRREVDLAAIRADTPTATDVRMIAELYPDFFQIIAGGQSGIREVGDLIGRRIAIPEFGTDAFRSFWIVADHYDLPIEGMRWSAMGFERAAAGLLDGTYDAIFTVRSLRDRPLIRMFEDAQLKNHRLVYVPIRQAEAISLKRPFMGSGTIPTGAFTGATPVPGRDMPSSVVARNLVTRADVDEGAIRELTRILFEHRLDLTIRFSLASAIRQPDEARGLNLPLHEGADAFFKRDDPSFLQENAEPITLLVTVTAMMVSVLIALRSRLMAMQKNRADRYNHILLDINRRAISAGDHVALDTLDAELASIQEAAVVALDTDEVTDDGFQSFAMLWSSVRQTISDRRNQLA